MRLSCASISCLLLLAVGLHHLQGHACEPTKAKGEQPSAKIIADQILASSAPAAERERLIAEHIELAPELIAAMTENLKADSPRQYDRIPWIWRVAIAAGRRNDAKQLLKLLDITVPMDNAPLHDWQAVVLGGGVINGLSQLGIWPEQRINEIIGKDKELARRWQRTFELASAMADDEKVPTGTRYDALRMVPMEGWEPRGKQLAKYLAKDINEELQMGAVSGISDINDKPAATALIASLGNLTYNNRKLAWQGLLRTDDRAKKVLEAIGGGTIKRTDVPSDVAKRLKEHANQQIRDSAVKLLN
jgi:hypothetical protein